MNNYIHLAVCVSLLFSKVLSYSVEETTRLEEDLLQGYKTTARPAEQTNVTCTLTLSNILEFDIVEQTLTVSAYLIGFWYDPRLAWNTSQYNGTDDGIYLHFDQVWRPPLYLSNAAREFKLIGDQVHEKTMPIKVNPSGRVFWSAPAYFVGRCSAEVSNFPFDQHTCKFILNMWLYTGDEVSLQLFPTDSLLGVFYEANSEWDIISTSSGYENLFSMGNVFPALSFSVSLERKTSYYVLYIIIPVVVFNLVSAVVFAVPPGSGEKLTFSLTMLLSITVLMTIVGEKIPTSSLQVSKLGVYLVLSMALNILEVIVTVVILRLYNTDQESIPTDSCWYSLIKTISRFFGTRFSCRRKNSGQLVKVSPEEPSDMKKGNKEELKLRLDDEQETIQFKHIAKKLDSFCLYIFMTVTVLWSVGFVIAIAAS